METYNMYATLPDRGGVYAGCKTRMFLTTEEKLLTISQDALPHIGMLYKICLLMFFMQFVIVNY